LRANASASLIRETIRLVASARSMAAGVVSSPRTTTSISIVMRRTPCVMVAIPPVTIQGTPVARRALATSASALSSRCSAATSLGLLLRTLLNLRPPATDLLYATLGDLIARPGPQPHRLHCVQRGQGLGDGLGRAGAFLGQQAALTFGRNRVAEPPALY